MRGRRPVIRLSMVGLRIELPDTKDRPCEDARCVKARGEPYAWLADTPSSCSPPRPLLTHPHSLFEWAVSASLHGERSSRSEEHTSELQSLMRISYAVFCLKKKNTPTSELYTQIK